MGLQGRFTYLLTYKAEKKFDDIYSLLYNTIPACDRQTDRHATTAIAALCRASRGKKVYLVSAALQTNIIYNR